jgi:hypothetical protein
VPDLNQHPSRDLPRLDSSVRLEEIWFRMEHQALVGLERTGGILFGIRVSVCPLRELAQEGNIKERFIRALRTMPEAVAQYKGLLDAREKLLSLLQQTDASGAC